MNPVTIVIGFVPLVLFSFLDGRLPVGIAALVSAIVALAVVAAQAARRLGFALPVVQTVALAVIAVLAFTGGPATREFLTTYGRGLASLALAGYVLLTVPFAPFTAAFARAGAPRELWHNPRFVALNQRISAAWGGAVLVLGVTHLATAAIAPSLRPFQALLVQWVPTIVVVILAIRYTRRSVGAARAPQHS